MIGTSNWRGIADSIANAVGDLIFPLTCLVCGAEGDRGPWCRDCRDEILNASTSACPRCAQEIGPWETIDRGCGRCRSHALGFDAAVALGPYQGPIRDVCLKIKRVDNAWLTRHLGEMLFKARAERLRAESITSVVSIPLHWRRQLSRGYNQADAVARSLASRLDLPVRDGLRCVVATQKLAELSRTERIEVRKDSFRVRGNRSFAGETVLLVDDILTTGATCGAAARALKSAGASRVVVAVIGRA